MVSDIERFLITLVISEWLRYLAQLTYEDVEGLSLLAWSSFVNFNEPFCFTADH